jgi:hypothetical protein
VINKRTTDVFVIKSTIDNYLKVKRGRIYWCMVGLEKAFDSIDREALWFKMRQKGVSEKMVRCTGLFKKDGAKIKACGESGKSGNRSITEGNEGERLQVHACVCTRMRR